MEKIKIHLEKKGLGIAGETSGGSFCTGYCNLYCVESETGGWKAEIAHSFYENGEEEIVAKKIIPERLNIIRNRLRMVVTECHLPQFAGSKSITLRIASLKKESTSEWANLKNASMGDLSEIVGGNAVKYFKNIGAHTVDYKADIFNQSGSTANQLVAIYPKDNTHVPIYAFIVTRVLPFT